MCIDKSLPRKSLDNIRVTYTDRFLFKGRAGRMLAWFTSIIRLGHSADLIFVKQFPGSFLIPLLLGRKRTILDIRTRSLKSNVFKQSFEDFLIFLDAHVFRNVVVLSAVMKSYFRVPHGVIIPLGAETRENRNLLAEQKDVLTLLYVGTFEDRHLETVICGFKRYIDLHPHSNIQLRMVGGLGEPEVPILKNLVTQFALEEKVIFTGYLTGDELEHEFINCDVGIVHVPNERRYHGQPSTKLFEYWSFGKPALVTETLTNMEFTSTRNSVMYEDSAEGFQRAISDFVVNRHTFEANEIFMISLAYSWESIVSDQLAPYLYQRINLIG